ncbi:MAG: hypothetical protein WCT03_16060 [Candidatus Obscuribacterales bacterium]|jgi:hypothetical protein
MNTKHTAQAESLAQLSTYDTGGMNSNERLLFDVLAHLHFYFSERPIVRDADQLAALGYSSNSDYLEDILEKLLNDSDTLRLAVKGIAIENNIDI